MTPRTQLCLECRTVLAEGEACDTCGEEPVLSLLHAPNRERAVERAWMRLEIQPTQQPPIIWRVLLMASIGFVLSLTMGLIFVLGARNPNVEMITVLGISAAMLLLFLPHIAERRRLKKGLPPAPPEVFHRPRGAEVEPIKPPRLPWLHGTLRVRDPGRRAGAEGVPEGYGAELVEALSTEHVMYRDSISHGFEIELDDGRVVLVEPGRIRIAARKGQGRTLALAAARKHLEAADPSRAKLRGRLGHESDPFPFDHARRLVIEDGTPVSVAAELESRREGDAGYRQQSKVYLRPKSIVWLRAD
jgi:hypothetical protein